MASLDTLYKRPETRGDIKVKSAVNAQITDNHVALTLSIQEAVKILNQ